MRARLTCRGGLDLGDPETSVRLQRAWGAKVKPPKWPCLYTYTDDGILVSYYNRRRTIICKAVKTYTHALTIFHELRRAALKEGLIISFDHFKVSNMMAVLDARALSQPPPPPTHPPSPLHFDTSYLARQLYATHYDPRSIHSLTVIKRGTWVLWASGKFVLVGARSMRTIQGMLEQDVPHLLTAAGLAQSCPR